MSSYDASAVATASASTTLVITKPANVVSGSLLIAVIARAATGTPTLSGWSTVACPSTKNLSSQTLFGTGCGFMWKWAGGSEGANYTFTSTSSEWIGRMFAIHGLTPPLLYSDGTPVGASMFDYGTSFSRSGTSLVHGTNVILSDLTYDHYWVIAGPALQEAAATRTLSAMTGHMGDTTYSALVGVSLATGIDEWTNAVDADSPVYPATSCTTSNASGTGRGYLLAIGDPATARVDVKARRRRSAGNRGNVASMAPHALDRASIARMAESHRARASLCAP